MDEMALVEWETRAEADEKRAMQTARSASPLGVMPFLVGKVVGLEVFYLFPSIVLISRLVRRLVPKRNHLLVSHFSPSTSLTMV